MKKRRFSSFFSAQFTRASNAFRTVRHATSVSLYTSLSSLDTSLTQCPTKAEFNLLFSSSSIISIPPFFRGRIFISILIEGRISVVGGTNWQMIGSYVQTKRARMAKGEGISKLLHFSKPAPKEAAGDG